MSIPVSTEPQTIEVLVNGKKRVWPKEEYLDYKGIVEVTCYGKTRTWERDSAKAFFLNAMANSEGSERERYSTIYLQLVEGRVICSDEP